MMTLYYEGSDGSIIDFMGKNIFAQNPESLTKNSWSYSTISGVNGLGKIKKFYKEIQESQLQLSIMADAKKEFDEIMYNIHRVFDRDIRRLKPGKLWWNGFYKEVFAVTTEQDEFDELFESIERKVTFLSTYDYWIKKNTYQYVDMSDLSAALDYPYDFNEFDYDREEFIEVIDNNCIDKANFEIKFYGPCSDPSVTVGNHLYEVNTTLSESEYITINSIIKKIYKYDIYGNRESILHLRNRDSYIFEPIPEGRTAVLRNKDLKVDITIFDERGEPDWI